MNIEQKNLLKLINTALFNVEFDGGIVDVKKLYYLAKRQNLLATFIKGVFDANITLTDKQTTKLNVEIYKIQGQNERQLHYIELIKNALNTTDCKYCLLKGAYLKTLYPVSYLREMNDIDILYENLTKKEIKLLFENLGLTHVCDTDFDDHYTLSPHINVEMHNTPTLISNLNNGYYKNIFDRLITTNNKEYFFNNEDFVIYHILHAYRHFVQAGVGIKPIVDLYLLTKKLDLNNEYIIKELTTLKLNVFYEKLIHLTKVWFEGEKETEFTNTLTNYLFNSGAFGHKENYVNNQKTKQGKFKYLLKRVFAPYNELKINYKILTKLPILLPFIWFIRLFKFKKIKKELTYLKGNIKNDIDYLFEELEL